MTEERDMFFYEKQCWEKRLAPVCGVDEAGRGPLAGPVCVAAVILNDEDPIEGLDDSKKLTEKKRETLYKEIVKKAAAYSIIYIQPETIDSINILQATYLGMRQAVEKLKIKPRIALIDGNGNPSLKNGVQSLCIVKGDAKSASIAAASILAKVSRDCLMLQLDKEYPGYELAKHKGYPTKLHYEKLQELGVSKIHRRSFLKKLEKKSS